jgi:hypothetical protein
MMRVPATEAIVVIVVAAKMVLWMLSTEAVVLVFLAMTITWMLATVAVGSIVAAKTMTWLPLAKATQAGRLLAQAMVFVPAAEAAEVNVLKQRFGAGPAIVVEQRRSCDRWGGRYDEPGVRRSRVQSERSEDDAAQQHAMSRSQGEHTSPMG